MDYPEDAFKSAKVVLDEGVGEGPGGQVLAQGGGGENGLSGFFDPATEGFAFSEAGPEGVLFALGGVDEVDFSGELELSVEVLTVDP